MILICGIPDAGKTTYSQRFPDVIHYDDVKGGRRRRQLVIDMVRENPTICVEGVYGSAQDRSDLVMASNVENTCIWLNTPEDVCIERELNGRRRSMSGHMIKWAAEEFEPPTYDEGWDKIEVIHS